MIPATEPERQFHEAMLGIYRRAKAEAGYNATRFLHMVGAHGGLHAAQSLLASQGVSDGYTELYLRGRLDLTVEALVLQPRWATLFSDTEIDIARNRLAQYGYAC